MTGAEILALPMDRNDAGATTIREYLIELVRQVWNRGESFSGKRPFGNSGWEGDLQIALIKGGAVTGTLDEDGYIETIEDVDADDAINNAIDALSP